MSVKAKKHLGQHFLTDESIAKDKLEIPKNSHHYRSIDYLHQ